MVALSAIWLEMKQQDLGLYSLGSKRLKVNGQRYRGSRLTIGDHQTPEPISVGGQKQQPPKLR